MTTPRRTQVLIAHARNEADQAERLAGPIRAAGYAVAHEGTVLVGDSVVAEASRLLAEGSPVVLCGTIRAMGTRWANQVVQAARAHPGVRVFVVQMDDEADTGRLAFDETVARHWEDPIKAAADLIAALRKWYPPDADTRDALRGHDLEARYRKLALTACDIVDLANLPEDDRHLATRELELRRLYVALRMRVEVRAGDEPDDAILKQLERRRAAAWGDHRHRDGDKDCVSVGEHLGNVRRLVVLGDPGAGKSTLLRWLATAYLLRLQQAPDWADLPDIATLPDADWLPILIRCRDLPPEADTLDAMLLHSLRRGELPTEHCEPLRQLLRERLTRGDALLLVDGLDEITDPGARARFAAQLEKIHRIHDRAPMVVTSRIVGYREMGHRIRCGFEHLTVADLSKQDKDVFARRWCALTERPEQRDAAAAELIRDIHASDRIERLTGNPMLLTTMALIRRKVGRLPQRRVDLYEKAVEVLLNWRSQVDVPLDPREALPQLEYLAHAMCADGVQQVREDQALDLLRRVREDFPQIHALGQHGPEEFLDLLERRTGLVIQSGQTRHKGRSVPVYEFRHLTFQEYLAGIALVQGHYRERDDYKDLAEALAPLAGQVGERYGPDSFQREFAVVENWREALRLSIAACGDDKVDAALLAILSPLPGETFTARPRAIMAALCLADEPNVSNGMAEETCRVFVAAIEKSDGWRSPPFSLDAAAMELARSRWSATLSDYLLDEFFLRGPAERGHLGRVYAMIHSTDAPGEEWQFPSWLAETASRLADADDREAVAVALRLPHLALKRRDSRLHNLASGLTRRLSASPPMRHAAVRALAWLSLIPDEDSGWRPDCGQLARLVAAVMSPDCESETLYWLAHIFGYAKTGHAVVHLLTRLPESPPRTQAAILNALGAIGDQRGLNALHECLGSDDKFLRIAALDGLAQTCEDEIDRKLLSHGRDGVNPLLDPRSPINAREIAIAAERLERSPQEIRERYERLARQFGLRLE